MSDTHWKKIHNTNYLGSYDFEQGQEMALTIKFVSKKEVFNPNARKEEECVVCEFVENVKPMILNKTNCKMIEKLHKTPYVEHWANKKIIVGVSKEKIKGKLEECLRIRDKLPQGQQQEVKPVPIICEECGEQVVAIGNFPAEYIAKKNKEKYGTIICGNCSKKRKELEENETNAE